MGTLQNFESSERGGVRMNQLRAFGREVGRLVDSMIELPINYDVYRKQYEPGVEEDAEDLAYSDYAFDLSVSEHAKKFELLSPDQKQWLDRYLKGLGYEPVKE